MFQKLMLLSGVLLITGTGAAFAQKKEKKDKPLENKVFTISIQEEKTAKPAKPLADELSFKGDKIKSKAMDEKWKFKTGNFKAVADSTNPEEPVVTFDAEMPGDTKDDKMVWKGTVTGEAGEDIEGTVTWLKRDKVKKEFSFSGSLRKKK
jgi:hypothetical protein